MKTKQLGLAFALAAFATLPARGALVISEVLFNEVGSDTTGEWIEIYNNGAAAIDLSNYKIGDEEASLGTGAGEAMHQFPAGATIAPGDVQIVAVSATRFFDVYGFLPDYEANATNASVPDLSIYSAWDPDGTAFNMANGGDQALILNGSDAIVDAVSWGTSTFAFDPALGTALDGQSYERINVFIDTNTGADWKAGPTADEAVNRSTPGAANIPEPTSLAMVASFLVMGAAALRRSR